MPDATLFLVFLIAHVLADYYFQTPALAARKEASYAWLLFHCLIYAVIMFVGFAIVKTTWWVFALAAGTHWLIDSVKWALRNTKLPKAGLFVADQIMHVLVLLILTRLAPGSQIRSWFAQLALPESFLPWAALILIILKPVNVAVDILFEKYALAAKEENQRQDRKARQIPLTEIAAGDEDPATIADENPLEVEGAGAWVGILERLIAVLFISMGQYAALGLLMAAKSMARYDKISKAPAFAEYYLIGTLFSLLFAIAAYLFIFEVVVPLPVVVEPTPIILITPTSIP